MILHVLAQIILHQKNVDASPFQNFGPSTWNGYPSMHRSSLWGGGPNPPSLLRSSFYVEAPASTLLPQTNGFGAFLGCRINHKCAGLDTKKKHIQAHLLQRCNTLNSHM